MPPGNRPQTLDELYQAWRAEYGRTAKPSTYATYTALLSQCLDILAPARGHRPGSMALSAFTANTGMLMPLLFRQAPHPQNLRKALNQVWRYGRHQGLISGNIQNPFHVLQPMSSGERMGDGPPGAVVQNPLRHGPRKPPC